MSVRLVAVALLLPACLPHAWEDERPARLLEAPIGRFPPDSGNPGGGMGGGIGMGGGAGGFDGGGLPLAPEVTGSFVGGSQPRGPFLRSPLRSTTLSTVPGTSSLVAVVDDSDALYVLAAPNRKLALPADSRPSSVTVAPDGLTAWVALRGLGSVARVVLATGATTVVPVGAEPTGVSLSPTGRTLVVATFGERTVSLLDTTTLAFRAVDVGGHPRALTITDDGDGDDADESAWVTLFFGEPLAEGSDSGRRGVVVEVGLGTGTVISRVTLGPISGGFSPCSPNQLYAIAQQAGALYVSHVCASPGAPQGANASVRAGLSVIDLSTRAEVPAASRLLQAMELGVSLMANPVDVAPFPSGSVLVLSQGANAVQLPQQPFSSRVGLSPFYMGAMTQDDPVSGVPTGLLVIDANLVFVLDATGRRVFELAGVMPMRPAVPWLFETIPPPGSPAHTERLGRRHFATAEGLWSSFNAVSCVSCHPDGLTDNLTWVFTAGPRQTPSLAGTFQRGVPANHRAQGWTATSDEISDVEGIVRSLAGGTGAITVGGGAQIPLGEGYFGPGGLARHDGLSASSRDLVIAHSPSDWLDLEAWITTLPRPPASRRLDPLAVSRGRQLFAAGNCAACHGGPLWTVSRVPYVPSFMKNGSAVGDDNRPNFPSGLRLEARSGALLWNPALNTDTLKVAPEQVMINGQPMAIGPERITCVLRDVGTFERSDPLEVKSTGLPAQGEKGFNPPSLFGLATSAPYLHHGKAKTLTELFSPPYARHHQAGAPGFLAAADGGVDEGAVNDLITFLESIDETTLGFDVPPGADVCGGY